MSPHDLDNAFLDKVVEETGSANGTTGGSAGKTRGMDKIVITGGVPLKGDIRIGGAKNSVVGSRRVDLWVQHFREPYRGDDGGRFHIRFRRKPL